MKLIKSDFSNKFNIELNKITIITYTCSFTTISLILFNDNNYIDLDSLNYIDHSKISCKSFMSFLDDIQEIPKDGFFEKLIKYNKEIESEAIESFHFKENCFNFICNSYGVDRNTNFSQELYKDFMSWDLDKIKRFEEWVISNFMLILINNELKEFYVFLQKIKNHEKNKI